MRRRHGSVAARSPRGWWRAAGGAALLALGGALATCGEAPKPPPSNPAHVDVQYEPTDKPAPNAPAPPRPPVAAAPAPMPTYWKDKDPSQLFHAPPPPAPAELALPKVDRWKLKNGLEVIVVARKDLPVVSFSIAVKSGGYDEEKGKNLGVSDFTAEMLRKGTRTRTADDISNAVDSVGAALDTQSSNESSSAGCSALSKDAKLCLDLLADIMLRPSFPEAEMADVRDQMLAALNGRYDNPGELAAAHFDNLLFGEKHPDGWILAPEDVQKITREQLVTFWKTYYRPNNAILAVAGDVDPARLRGEIDHAFGAWEKADVPPRPAFKIPDLKATRVLLVDRPDLTQATIVFGHAGISHADPDWYAVTLMNYVLGGSDFSSRLMMEVRTKRGLTYGIGSSFGASLYEGAFRVSASTKNSSVWEALVAAVDELRRMKAEGPTPEELDKAKGYFAGSYPFKLQGADGIAASIAGAELHGLGIEHVRDLPLRLAAVSAAKAREAAGKWLQPDGLWVVIVGRAADIEPQIAKSGLRYEKIDFKDPISYAARARLRKPEAAPPAPPKAQPQPQPPPQSQPAPPRQP
jgi:zinc protease